jgi:predicted PurR-regulated permease PerM
VSDRSDPLRAPKTLLLARGLMYMALVVVGYVVIDRVAVVIAPVGTGLFLAYLLNPLVERLERRRVPRPVGIVLLLALSAALVVAAAILIPSLLSREARAFADRWRDYESRIETVILPWLRGKLHLPRRATAEETVRGLFARFGGALEGATGDVMTALRGVFRSATGLLRVLLAVLLTPVFSIYFLSDYPMLKRAARQLVPPRHREQVMSIVAEVNHALASWLRGQLTVMLILGTLYATGLAIAGIPLGVAIGIATGLMAFVPYVGVGVGLVLALLSALLDPQPATGAIGVLATFGAVQALDALVITPRVLGGQVGLSPVAVIFALTLGGELLGYAGLLLAVPSAAVCKVLLGRAYRAYVESAFYTGAAEGAPPLALAPEPPSEEAREATPQQEAPPEDARTTATVIEGGKR